MKNWEFVQEIYLVEDQKMQSIDSLLDDLKIQLDVFSRIIEVI